MSVMKKSENCIALSGRIDSANAAATEQEIASLLDGYTDAALTVDAETLEYISSAGLRVLLRLRKQHSDMKIVNVCLEVYEVFEMTGFTEMMPISKAYRKVSVEGCEVIGQGANGKVYRIDPDTIVKVYYNPDALPDIKRERELARTAYVLGIPTAIPYDVVRVGDGYGSVFELLNAKSFAKLIAADPEGLDGYVAQFVDLMKLIHSTTVKPGIMPEMKTVALDWADFLKDYLPGEAWEKLHALIAGVPEQLTMLHGDYHTKNVMLQNGEVILIDMDTLCTGHPVFELASVFNAFVGFSELDPSVAMAFQGFSRETCNAIWDKTLRLYFGTEDEAILRARAEQAMLIGYTRLMRRTIRRRGLETEEGREAITHYRSRILELLERVDSLTW